MVTGPRADVVEQGPTGRTNWAGNIAYRAARIHRPTTVEELQEIVAGTDRLRPLGTGHSFNRLADTEGDLVSVSGLPPVLEVDASRRALTVSGGTRYGELAAPLHERGWALHNLGSLPHISVAGAVATGTHGSGIANGSLSTAVRALQLVRADGELVTVDRDDGDPFSGAVVALGALGIVTSVTLDLVPAFDVAQHVYDDLPLEVLISHLDEVMAAAYSVSVFTNWRDPVHCQVWLKRRVDDGAAPPPREWLGARLADGPRHMLGGMSPANCTPQLGEPGPWHERLPHFRLGFTPSRGEELQSEYFVARPDAPEALRALTPLRERIAPVLQTAEVRTVAADGLWLSPAYRRDSVALHFTWVADGAAVAPVVAVVEEALGPFRPRPHWGKVSGLQPAAVAAEYDRIGDFAGLVRRTDPRGAFRNDLLDAYVTREPAERLPFTS
jgi:alditol oxidase